MEIPSEPVIFFKATSSLVGPNDDLVIPKHGQKVDWEVELAVVIGKEVQLHRAGRRSRIRRWLRPAQRLF